MQGLAQARPVARRLVVDRLASGGSRVVDDCYNANPASMAAALDTSRASPCPRAAGPWRCSATCSSWARRARRRTGASARRRPARAWRSWPASGRARREGTAEAALRRRPRRTSHREWTRWSRWLRPQLAQSGDVRAGEGQPRHEARAAWSRPSLDSPQEGTEMLFLLYEWLAGPRSAAPQLPALPDLPHRRGGGGRAAARACSSGRWLHRAAARPQHGQSNVREDTPDTHKKKKGTPIDGRRAHPALHRGDLDAALRGPAATALVWAALLVTARLRLHRLPGRLAQALEAQLEGARREEEARPPDARSSLAVSSACLTDWRFGADGFPSSPSAASSTLQLTLPFVPTHLFSAGPRLALPAVRGPRRGRDVERGEPHRRPRRPRDRAHHRLGHHLRRALLRGWHHLTSRTRDHRAAVVSLAEYLRIPHDPRRRGARRVLRGHRRRGHRLPLVQHLPGLASSWATSARSRSAARSACSPCSPRTRWRARSSTACSSPRRSA